MTALSVPDLRDRRVTVVGGACSGLAVARLLMRAGAVVFLTERGTLPEGIRNGLVEAGAAYEHEGHTARALDTDFLVVSPGVPSTANLVRHALRLGRGPIVAVTGSNGKTTTTTMLARVYREAGRPHIVAGNIGFAFSDYVADATAETTALLEVSSFQLDHIDTFRPRVSLLLNITPDHLDRYNNNFNEYAQSKFRIFENQAEGDVLVYGYDDPFIRDYVEWRTRNQGLRVLPFSTRTELEAGAFVRDGRLILRLNQQEDALMYAHELALPGAHNLANALAVSVAARVDEIRSDVVRKSLMRFEGVAHRMEFVREIDGVRYINDSKATNVNAVWYALDSFREPIILIAGGRDKGNDYAGLRGLVRERVKAVIGIGESAEKVVRELGRDAPDRRRAHSMEEAIAQAHGIAEAGDVVLLSPACASFDMFENFEDRGDTFKRLVHSLRPRTEHP